MIYDAIDNDTSNKKEDVSDEFSLDEKFSNAGLDS
jgi:hypothetical protein